MSATRVTKQRGEETERVAAPSTLPPMLARQLASRREARRAVQPRHLPSAPGGERRRPGTGAVAIAGVLLAVGAVAAAVLAMWPRSSSHGPTLEAGAVTTTAQSMPTDRATAAGEAPASRPASPRSPTGSTVSGAGSGAARGDAASGDPAGPAPDAPATTGGASAGTTAGDGAVTAPPSTGAPSTASPPATAAPPGTETRAAAGAPPARGGRAATPTTSAPARSSPPRATGDPDDDATWDELARCESGADWSADRGNGRYGGLQIRVETWHRHGGAGFPHHHPREIQIGVARRIHAGQGWTPWSICARQLGYT